MGEQWPPGYWPVTAAGVPVDRDIIGLLRSRDGVLTRLRLRDGRELDVLNIAWGYDEDARYAHLTTNVSPALEGVDIDVFGTEEIAEMMDPATGVVVYHARGSSTARMAGS